MATLKIKNVERSFLCSSGMFHFSIFVCGKKFHLFLSYHFHSLFLLHRLFIFFAIFLKLFCSKEEKKEVLKKLSGKRGNCFFSQSFTRNFIFCLKFFFWHISFSDIEEKSGKLYQILEKKPLQFVENIIQ